MAETVEIYGLFDPDGQIRYIGKANCAAKRFKTHLWDSRHNKRPVCNWIRGLTAQGKLPRLEVLEIVDRASWQDAERRLIAKYRKTAKLLNLADGGDMPSQTDQQRVKAARASNKAQAASPAQHKLNLAKRDMGKLYARFKKKPDSQTYFLRLLMKCYAAENPEQYGCWANI